MVSTHEKLRLIVWRISNYPDLSGRGGLAADGRWHVRPKSVVYCADTARTAFIEVIQHFGGNEFLIPSGYQLLEIEAPERVAVDALDIATLPDGWSAGMDTGWPLCQPFGNKWLSSGRTAILKVPSAARPGSFNYLINPAHKDAEDIVIVRTLSMPWPTWVTREAG